MYYKKALYFFVGLLALAGVYKLVSNRLKPAPISHNFNEAVIGVYDRSTGTPASTATNNFQHVSITLTKSFGEKDVDDITLTTDKPALITVLMPEVTALGSSNLEKIAAGDYDTQLNSLCTLLSPKSSILYIRWNPEMEVPVQMVPWQNQSPYDYIRAFQHVATVCRTVSPNIKMVWGVAGYPGADEYWPGSEAVDAVSVTVDSQSESMATAYPHIDDAATQLRRKIHRMRFLDKPILILAPDKLADQAPTLISKAIQAIDQDKTTIYSTATTGLLGQQPPVRTSPKPVLGVYDPGKSLLNIPTVSVEHLFTDLGNIEDGSFEKSFNEIIARHHGAIVTFEPWKDKKHIQPKTVLQNVLNGLYDAQFREIYRLLSSVNQTVYLRFAHEMEIPIQRYPWQSQDPVLYTKAFRYFMTFDKQSAKNIKRVWGPAGDRGSLEWWPGSDVVDYISVAIYGLPDKNITDPKKQESFSTIFNRKYYRMRFTNKPIFVTEFGVKGPEDFQRQWLDDAASFINEHRQIVGICYFNLADNPEVWGKMPAPDWSVTKNTFTHFVSEITD